MESDHKYSFFERFLLAVRKRPSLFAAVSLFYLMMFFVTVYYDSPSDIINAPRRLRELREENSGIRQYVLELEDIISRLDSTRVDSTLFRGLNMSDPYTNDATKNSISRLVEYAEFAISKNDYERAEGLFVEANQIQPTVGVAYQQGRLAYFRGNLKRTVERWQAAISLDSDRLNIELRLYLGIVLHELGRYEDGDQLILEYATEKDRKKNYRRGR